jgi:hypothetical protein
VNALQNKIDKMTTALSHNIAILATLKNRGAIRMLEQHIAEQQTELRNLNREYNYRWSQGER